MPSSDLKKLKSDLTRVASQKDPARRGVEIAAVISEALKTINQDPVLVGGAAVEYYTEGEYTTGDIDMVAPGGPPLWELMRQLGFERKGKDYVYPKLDIYIEFPGETLGHHVLSNIIDINGTRLEIISIEDLVIDRLCSYKFWGTGQDGLAAVQLMEAGPLNENRLKERAIEENVLDALDYLQGLYEEIFRKKLSKKEASNKLQGWLKK
jgi:hypothetical protein